MPDCLPSRSRQDRDVVDELVDEGALRVELVLGCVADSSDRAVPQSPLPHWTWAKSVSSSAAPSLSCGNSVTDPSRTRKSRFQKNEIREPETGILLGLQKSGRVVRNEAFRAAGRSAGAR